MITWLGDIPLHIEAIVIGSSIVDDAAVELPRSSKEEMACGHGNHITLQGVFIYANLEGDLNGVLNLDGTRVAKPLDLVGMRMLHLDQLYLGTQLFTFQIVATYSVDDDLHERSIGARFGVEDVATLVFVLLVLKCQDLGDNESGARIIVAKHLSIFIFINLTVHDHVL